eukprot:1153352-Pelagomonas_calceolata.AAC.2
MLWRLAHGSHAILKPRTARKEKSSTQDQSIGAKQQLKTAFLRSFRKVALHTGPETMLQWPRKVAHHFQKPFSKSCCPASATTTHQHRLSRSHT